MHQVSNGGTLIHSHGPCTVLRLLAAAIPASGSAGITELAHMDVVVNDAGYRFGPLLSHAYGRTVGGKCTATPACTPGDRARAVWSPHAPDALVGFDVSTSRLLFPSAITGGVPWIGGLRVARHAWPDMHAETLEDILVARGMAEEAQAISDKGAELDASREVLGMAHLTRDMLSAIDVRCSAERLPNPARVLRPILGMFAADFALQSLINLSAIEAEPLRKSPDPWELARWATMPMDDLRCYARREGCDCQSTAVDEVRRRLGALNALPAAEEAPRVLLRRVPADTNALQEAA